MNRGQRVFAILLLINWACTGSSPAEPEEKWTIDPAFVGAWTGSSTVGDVTLTIYPSEPMRFLSNFHGELGFRLKSGEVVTYHLYGSGTLARFQCDFWERGIPRESIIAFCDGEQVGPGTIRLKWKIDFNPKFEAMLGKEESVELKHS